MSASTALQKRVSRVIEIGADSPAMLESLAAVSLFVRKADSCNRSPSDLNNQKKNLRGSEDTAVWLNQTARKGLGDSLERENRCLAENFFGCFGKVMQRLNTMEESLEGMEGRAESIIERLKEADDTVKSFSQRTKALRGQQGDLEARAVRAESLLNKFQLSSEEKDILKEGPEEKKEDFFVVLARLKAARDECHKLVGGQHQSAGFELLDTLSHQQEMAYESLYHWVLENCDSVEEAAVSSTISSQHSFNPTLQRALNALSDRPAFFSHCQERIVGVRRMMVRKSFFLQLAQGFHTGDVIQYIGDTLAWVHQTSAVQHEFAVGLVGEQASKRLVLHIMAGIAKPLFAHLEPIFLDQKDPVVLARASDFLGFYENTLLHVAGGGFTHEDADWDGSIDNSSEENSLSHILASLRVTARSEFLTSLKAVASQIENSHPTYSVDQSPLQITTASLRLLGEVLDIRESSLLQEDEEEKAGEDSPDSMENIIGIFVGPLLATCHASGQGLDPGDTSIFTLNTILAMQSVLAEKAGASSWVEKLALQAKSCLDEIVTYHSDRFFEACGMNVMLEVFSAAEKKSSTTALCDCPGVSQTEVEGVMGRFYSVLFSMTLPEFERIQSSWAREQVTTEVLVVVMHEYIESNKMKRDRERERESRVRGWSSTKCFVG